MANFLKSYAITISINGVLGQTKHFSAELIQQVLLDRYQVILDWVEPISSDRIFEISSSSTKLHLHGIFATYRKFSYKSLQCSGFQVYIRQLKTVEDEQEWFSYINKDQYLFDDNEVIDHGQKENDEK